MRSVGRRVWQSCHNRPCKSLVKAHVPLGWLHMSFPNASRQHWRPRHRLLGHLEDDVTSMAHDFGANLHEVLPETGQRPERPHTADCGRLSARRRHRHQQLRRSRHRPERSASAVKFHSRAIPSRTGPSRWAEAAVPCTVLLPTIQRMAESHDRRSASVTSSYPASRPNTD
jgi:hypothetical protein